MMQLAGMRGLMAKPSGEIIETADSGRLPRATLRRRNTSSRPTARGRIGGTPRSRPRTPVLTRRLVDVAQTGIVSRKIARLDGIGVRALIEGVEIIDRLSDRILAARPSRICTDQDGKAPRRREPGDHRGGSAGRSRCPGLMRVKIRSALTLREQARGVRPLLRPRPGAREDGRDRRGGGDHLRAIHRGAGTQLTSGRSTSAASRGR